jgi:hypothetical protein
VELGHAHFRKAQAVFWRRRSTLAPVVHPVSSSRPIHSVPHDDVSIHSSSLTRVHHSTIVQPFSLTNTVHHLSFVHHFSLTITVHHFSLTKAVHHFSLTKAVHQPRVQTQGREIHVFHKRL